MLNKFTPDWSTGDRLLFYVVERFFYFLFFFFLRKINMQQMNSTARIHQRKLFIWLVLLSWSSIVLDESARTHENTEHTDAYTSNHVRGENQRPLILNIINIQFENHRYLVLYELQACYRFNIPFNVIILPQSNIPFVVTFRYSCKMLQPKTNSTMPCRSFSVSASSFSTYIISIRNIKMYTN